MKNGKRFLSCLLSVLLLAALLTGCAGAQTPSPAEAETPEPTAVSAAPSEAPAPDERPVVRVSDMRGFLDALAPDTVIELACSQLKLERAPDYGFSYANGCYSWLSTGSGEYGLVIRGLNALTIRSAAEGGVTISTDALFADVLRFENCDDLTLEGLTLGHRGEPSGCAGDVLALEGCERAEIRLCELFGCGVIGVNAIRCDKLRLESCLVRDCQMAALNLTSCTDFQARDCEIIRCGRESPLAALCVASCEGFALINSRVCDGNNTFLLDAMNSSAVCLLGCEATGNRFSNALFRLYDDNITVSGSTLSDNEFGACYFGGAYVARTGAGQELITFGDFARMERKPFAGEYVGPEPAPLQTPSPAVSAPGEHHEVTVSTVDELLQSIAPHTTVYLSGEQFDLYTASGYGGRGGVYYSWVQVYDGFGLVLKDLEDFTLIGDGMGMTLLSTQPRYADVLSFDNCRDISLSDMTLGHNEEPGFCSGGVLNLYRCERVNVSRCGLFGCGTIGIEASDCAELHIEDSNIYDCSYCGANFYHVSNAFFTGCSITDCGDDYGINGLMLERCESVYYDGRQMADGMHEISQP